MTTEKSELAQAAEAVKRLGLHDNDSSRALLAELFLTADRPEVTVQQLRSLVLAVASWVRGA